MKPLRYISRCCSHRLRKRVTARQSLAPAECFLYHSLLIIIPCFGNFVNGKGTKNYSKNADFLVAILCKTYTKRFQTSFF